MPKVFYEAPSSPRVPQEMKRYIEWFNQAAEERMPTVIHAGMAHLYFELVHPFEDGNGRIGRAITEKALAIGARQSLITSLSTTIERKKKHIIVPWKGQTDLSILRNGYSIFLKKF